MMRMIKVLIIVIAVAWVCASQSYAENAESTRHEWNGHFYEVVYVPAGVTWNDAKLASERMGGHLVTISSPDENQFVYTLVSADDRYWTSREWGSGTGPWIGLYRSGSDWCWVTKESLSYINWEPGEPNDAYGGENYVVLAGRGSEAPARSLKGPNWDDVEDLLEKSFIIEYDALP